MGASRLVHGNQASAGWAKTMALPLDQEDLEYDGRVQGAAWCRQSSITSRNIDERDGCIRFTRHDIDADRHGHTDASRAVEERIAKPRDMSLF